VLFIVEGGFQKMYGRILGQGNFATVYELEIEGIKYACKKLKRLPDSYENEERQARFSREINLLKQFDHPNIIKVIRYDLTNYSYLMPKYEQNLETYLQQTGSLINNYDEMNNIMIQLTQAVKYCHQQGIKHRDIKPENILIENG